MAGHYADTAIGAYFDNNPLLLLRPLHKFDLNLSIFSSKLAIIWLSFELESKLVLSRFQGVGAFLLASSSPFLPCTTCCGGSGCISQGIQNSEETLSGESSNLLLPE